MARTKHTWTFTRRFRRHGFGWRSQLPVKRVKEAVSEIKKVRRKDPVLAAEGAVLFLERVSPALEHVDSSSGAIGSAVNRAIDDLVPIIGAAEVDEDTRRAWLDRLFRALEEDRMPYIEHLSDRWGDLCGSKEIASEQADALLSLTRRMLSPQRLPGDYFVGTSACLSALYRAERNDELIGLARGDHLMWHYRVWAVRALVAQHRMAEALRLAESSRGPWSNDLDIDRTCEDILLSSGLVDEAYERYGLSANKRSTYLATFRAVAKKYPSKEPATILHDLVATEPGSEGKWFAAAKSVGLYEDALALARSSPCEPKTLTRAARDFADEEPAFAMECGLLAVLWLARGYGYEVTNADVRAARDATLRAAENLGDVERARQRMRTIVDEDTRDGGFVAKWIEPIGP